MNIDVLILAGGNGSRMNFGLPKIFMPLGGKSIIEHLIDNFYMAGLKNITVVANKSNINRLKTLKKIKNIVLQKEQNGTAGAVKVALDCGKLKNKKLLIINGDGPVLCTQEIENFANSSSCDLCVLTTFIKVHSTYGRIVRDNQNNIKNIVEYRDATIAQKKICEGNAGAYLVDLQKLKNCINLITNNNSQGEYYITDILKIFAQKNYSIKSYMLSKKDCYLSVNTMHELYVQNKKMQKDIKQNLIERGVLFISDQGVYIDCRAKIGKGSVVYAGVSVIGSCEVGQNCVLMPNCVLIDSIIKDGTTVFSGQVLKNDIL